MSDLKKISFKAHSEMVETIENIAKQNGESVSETIRQLIEEGLTVKLSQKNTDLIANIVREQMEVVLKPSVERLAALSSKSGHMSATAAFLNVQALMDLVSDERKKDVRQMYEKARKMAVEYMRIRTDDWKVNEFEENAGD